MIKKMIDTYLIVGISTFLLVACSEHSDLQSWMAAEKQQAIKSYPEKPIPTINAMVTYTPPVYTGLNAFDPERLQAGRQVGGVDGPNGNRPREILESFGLENIEYVGSMDKAGKTMGFVRVDGHIYTIQNGNYLGQDFGKVMAIEPDRIVLQELVESTEGAWEHRDGSIIRADSADAKK